MESNIRSRTASALPEHAPPAGTAAGRRFDLTPRLLVLVLAALVSAVVHAQPPERAETVTTRHRPEYDPLGVRAGAFVLLPQITLEQRYDDNIFAAESDPEADSITRIRPVLEARSNWHNHSLRVTADGTIGRYAHNDAEEYDDYRLQADARIDITRDHTLVGGAKDMQQHEARGSPDDAGGVGPTIFDVASVFVGYRHRFNRVSAELRSDIDWLDFDDVEGDAGLINNDDRDRSERETSLEISYRFATGRTIFLRSARSHVDYDDRVDDNGVQRSSDGYEVMLGTSVQPSPLVFGDLAFGYSQRDYDDPTLQSIDGLFGRGRLSWVPSGLTTMSLSLARDIRETVLADAAGVTSSRFAIDLDHELLRNLLLNVRLSITDEEFSGSSREDRYTGVGLGATYLLNRYARFDVRYEYDARDSNADSEVDDFDRSRLTLSGRAQI